MDKYDLLRGIKEGGTFLLNCMWNDGDLEKHLPASLRRTIARKKIRFYTLNAVDIAMGLGLGGRINMLMQAAFFKLAGIIPLDDAVAYLNEAIVKTYGRKGHAVVDMNQEAVRQGIAMLHEVAVPAAWADATGRRPRRLRRTPRLRPQHRGRDEPSGRRRAARERLPRLRRRHVACGHHGL